MKNLAGDEGCDRYIRKELTEARIEIVEHQERVPHSEVPTRLTGRLGGFTFERAWYCWMVEGRVPLVVAEELYADPNGVEDVRVAGHCGCPPPSEWAVRYAPDGRQVISDDDYAEHLAFHAQHLDWIDDTAERYVRESEALSSEAFVTSYHIDTQKGLNFFTAKLREHGLVAVAAGTPAGTSPPADEEGR